MVQYGLESWTLQATEAAAQHVWCCGHGVGPYFETENCQTENSTVQDGSCNGQSNFESRQLAEQFRVQAASRATWSPGYGQSRFESRGRADRSPEEEQICRPDDANADQSTACRLPRHHTAQSEYLLNPCPTCTLT